MEFRGSFDLLEVEHNLFDILKNQMAPYLFNSVGDILVNVELTVSFGLQDGSPNLALATIVVDMLIQSSRLQDLTSFSQAEATAAVSSFFTGDSLNDYLAAVQAVPIAIDAIQLHDNPNTGEVSTVGETSASGVNDGGADGNDGSAGGQEDSSPRTAMIAGMASGGIALAAIILAAAANQKRRQHKFDLSEEIRVSDPSFGTGTNLLSRLGGKKKKEKGDLGESGRSDGEKSGLSWSRTATDFWRRGGVSPGVSLPSDDNSSSNCYTNHDAPPSPGSSIFSPHLLPPLPDEEELPGPTQSSIRDDSSVQLTVVDGPDLVAMTQVSSNSSALGDSSVSSRDSDKLLQDLGRVHQREQREQNQQRRPWKRPWRHAPKKKKKGGQRRQSGGVEETSLYGGREDTSSPMDVYLSPVDL